MTERIKTLTGWKHGLVAGGAFAFVYWFINEASVPLAANCSYLASPMTDLLAVIGACLCVWRGQTHDDMLVAAFGGAVIVIHALQFFINKTGLF
jgi:hypothetical protein